MLPFSSLLAIASLIGFFAIILFVLFGQITVRKLRKNSETKLALGTEFTSGWDILNVAQALSLPRAWSKKLENSRISFLYANSTLLIKNTTKFDRVLGRVFFLCWATSGLMFFSLMLLDLLGVFAK
jgi:hypothetical protein